MRRAFTLIEVLLVIAIAGGLMVLLGSGINTGTIAQTEMMGIQALQTGINVGLAQAQRDEGASIQVVIATDRVRVTRNGVDIPQYTRRLPSGITASPGTTLTCQTDGTLSAGTTLTLTSSQTTYALTVTRFGQVRRS